MHFDPKDVRGSPLFFPPFTSARVHSHFELVQLGGDMCSHFVGEGEVQARTRISGRYYLVLSLSGWYQLVPRTM